MPSDVSVKQLIINRLTKEQYEALENPSSTELYLVPDEGGDSYELPVATTSTLGGVKVDGTTITITEDGTISSTGSSGSTGSTGGTSFIEGSGIALQKYENDVVFVANLTNENTLGNPLESKGELSSEQAKFGSTSYKLNDQSITYDGEGALTEGEFTLSFWAYSDSDSTRNNSYAYLSSTGNICLYLNGKFTLGWDYNQYEPTTTPTLNNGWNFYVLEFTQKYMNGQIRVYVNGTKIFDKTNIRGIFGGKEDKIIFQTSNIIYLQDIVFTRKFEEDAYGTTIPVSLRTATELATPILLSYDGGLRWYSIKGSENISVESAIQGNIVTLSTTNKVVTDDNWEDKNFVKKSSIKELIVDGENTKVSEKLEQVLSQNTECAYFYDGTQSTKVSSNVEGVTVATNFFTPTSYTEEGYAIFNAADDDWENQMYFNPITKTTVATGDCTLEFFLKIVGQNWSMFDVSFGFWSEGGLSASFSNGYVNIFAGSSYEGVDIQDVTFSEDTHVAIVRKNSTTTVFINGVNKGSFTSFTQDLSTDTRGLSMNGNGIQLHNIRFSNVARYTNEFSVSDISFFELGSSDKIQIDVEIMKGADGTDDGVIGLVPAPKATDNNKFLRGDGTWVEVSGNGSTTSYELPTASTTTLGGVKVDGTTITIDENGVISSTTTSNGESSGVTSVNEKTGDVVLTGADINVTYTHDLEEVTTDLNSFASSVDADLSNLTELVDNAITPETIGNHLPANLVTGTGITQIVRLTQTEYDALTTKNENTFYVIVGE